MKLRAALLGILFGALCYAAWGRTPATSYSTTGAGTISQGSGFPWSASWSSTFDGSSGTLSVLAKLGNAEKIRCDSLSWASVNEDGSISAQGIGSFMGLPRWIFLHVSPGSPVGCTIYVYSPFYPPMLFTFPVTVTSGTLTIW